MQGEGKQTIRFATAFLFLVACPSLMLAQQPDETAQHFYVFPQLADGDGWQFSLLVTNVSQSASQCAFSLYGMDVDRFADISGITAAGSTATFDLEGPGDYLVWGTKNELSVASGSATLDCSASVVAQVLYALLDQFGETAGMATVFSSQAAAVFQFPVLEQGTLALVARCRRAAQRARRTIQGCEAMHMIRKGQARGVSSSDVWRQIQFINKRFEVAA